MHPIFKLVEEKLKKCDRIDYHSFRIEKHIPDNGSKEKTYFLIIVWPKAWYKEGIKFFPKTNTIVWIPSMDEPQKGFDRRDSIEKVTKLKKTLNILEKSITSTEPIAMYRKGVKIEEN